MTIVIGTSVTRGTIPPPITVSSASTAAAHAGGILLHNGLDVTRIDAVDHLSGEIPAEHLDAVCGALGNDGRDCAHEGRFTRGVDCLHVRVRGQQVLRGGKGVVLDVAPVHDPDDLDVRVGADGVLEALLPDVLNGRVQRPDDPDLGAAAHVRVHVGEERVANLLTGAVVVDADLGHVRTVGQDGIDGYHRDAGVRRLDDGRHDAVRVDGDDDDPVDSLRDVRLDGIVLGGRIVVRVEDGELRPGALGGLHRTVIELVEEQRLLIDLHERKGLRPSLIGNRQRRTKHGQRRDAGGNSTRKAQERRHVIVLLI